MIVLSHVYDHVNGWAVAIMRIFFGILIALSFLPGLVPQQAVRIEVAIVSLPAADDPGQNERPRRVKPQGQGRTSEEKEQRPGPTIAVPPGGDLQAAINAARFGDTIVLTAGATYETPADFTAYSLGNKGSGSNYITITSSVPPPPHGVRVTLADRAKMPKLVVKKGSPFFDAKTGAHHFRLSYLYFTNKAGGTTAQLLATNGYDIVNPADFSQWPHDIIIDHCWFNPAEWDAQPDANLYSSVNTASGLAGVNITHRDSVMKGFGGRYVDRQTILDGEAISISVAPGPMTIDNCFLESWFAQFFIGGGDTGTNYHATVQATPAPTLTSARLSNVTNLHVGDNISFKMDHPSPHTGEWYACGTIKGISGNDVTFTHLVSPWQYDSYSEIPDGAALPAVGAGGDSGWNGYLPSNMTITHNYFNKPLRWYKMNGSDGKGFFEIKAVDGCLIDGNIFDGFTGFTVTVRNQGGKSPWANIKNLTMSNNLAIRFGAGLAFLGKDGQRLSETSSNIFFVNNLMYGDRGPDPVYGLGPKVFTGGGGGDNIQIIHNTVLQSGPMAWIGSGPANRDVLTRFVWRDNITNWGDSPRSGYGCLNGQTHRDCTPGYSWTRSVMIGDGSRVGGLSAFPPGNWNPAFIRSVGFVDPNNHNYRLLASSPYYKAASDGKDVGCDVDQLLTHLGDPVPHAATAVTWYALFKISTGGNGREFDTKAVAVRPFDCQYGGHLTKL